MTDILSLRGQMQSVSESAYCSIDFVDDDKVELWWVDDAKKYSVTLGIHCLHIKNKKFHTAIREAKKVMR